MVITNDDATPSDPHVLSVGQTGSLRLWELEVKGSHPQQIQCDYGLAGDDMRLPLNSSLYINLKLIFNVLWSQ